MGTRSKAVFLVFSTKKCRDWYFFEVNSMLWRAIKPKLVTLKECTLCDRDNEKISLLNMMLYLRNQVQNKTSYKCVFKCAWHPLCNMQSIIGGPHRTPQTEVGFFWLSLSIKLPSTVGMPYLSKWAFANERINLVSVEPFLARIDYVIMIGIIVTVVVCVNVDLALLMSTLISLGPWSCPSLLFCIVYLQ